MNNDTFLIEDADLEQAQEVCKFIENAELRNRATANAVAADIANKYFVDVEVDTKSGIHNVGKVLEKIEISDVYVKGAYIDVRFYFEENELCVPKSHFDRNLLPVAYMFIKLNPDLSGGTVAGFILSGLVNTVEEFNGYYKVNEEDLVSFYDIEPHLVTKDFVDMPDGFETSIYDYLDDNLQDENAFYQVLVESIEARERLIDASKVKDIFRIVSVVPSIDDEKGAKITTEPVESELFEAEDEDLLASDAVEDLEMVEDLEEEIETLEPLEELDVDIQDDVAPLEEFDNESQEDLIGLEEVGTDSQDFETLEETSIDSIELTIEAEDSLEEDEVSLTLDSEGETLQEEEVISSQETDDALPDEEELPSFANINFEEITIGGLTEAKDEITPTPVVQEETKADETSILQEEAVTTPVVDAKAITETEILTSPATEEDSDIDDLLSLVLEDESESTDTAEVSKESENLSIVNEVEANLDPAEETQFTTTTTPSMEEIEQATLYDELEEMLDNEEKSTVVEQTNVTEKASEDVDTLFESGKDSVNEFQDNFIPKPKGNKLLPALGVLTFIAALGYFGYTKFMTPELPEPLPQTTTTNKVSQIPKAPQKQQPVQDAMPVETVENVKTQTNTNEGNAISIPAIEQNLDVSVVISNLSVNWEVPASYLSNNTAKRYFYKLGKIIQLHLKTELLLLDKTPITNKITAELEFNANTGKFSVKGLTISSGEQIVDKVIKQTVQNALDMNFNTNMNVFNNLPGNPVLIIKL